MEEKREKRIRQITIELSIAWGLISWYFVFFYLNPYVYPLEFPWYTDLAYFLISLSNSIAVFIAGSLITHFAPDYISEWVGYSLVLMFQVAIYFYIGKFASWIIILIVNKFKPPDKVEIK